MPPVSAPARYVISDIHGHRDDLAQGLRAAGLLDGAEGDVEGHWSGGDATVWVLGDLFDRGPDGVGSVDLAMRLEHEAGAAGGAMHVLLGNHEVLALGTHLFGDTPLPGQDGRSRSFAISWLLNGGSLRDQSRLTSEHIAWLSTRPALALDGDLLLMHSDTTEYLHWGGTIDGINAGVRAALTSRDLSAWWEVWQRLTARYAFAGRGGQGIAATMLRMLGGERIVHGHSIIASLTGQDSAQVQGPLLYAGGLALAIDGGRYAGGPLLLVRL